MPKSRGFTRINFYKQNLRGFTLIELLVTISIIAILTVIGIVVYTSVMKQGRDSKRQSDLRSLQSSLEQYYADQGFYPASINANNFDSMLNQTPPPAFSSSIGNPTPPSPAKTYQNYPPQDPTDPTGSLRYRYEALLANCDNSTSNKCTGYCLYANLENSNPGKPAACTSYPTYNFAITPP